MMRNVWDKHASNWDSNQLVHEYADNALSSLLAILKQHSFDLSGKRVMDFGCGTGLLSERLSPLVGEVVSVDSSTKMIEQLEEKHLLNVWALSTDVDLSASGRFPVLTDNFDLILACSVCSFLDDFEGKLGVLSDMLNPGGLFVHWDWLRTEDNNDFGLDIHRVEMAYTKADLCALKIDTEFEMSLGPQAMPVLMGVGKRNG